MLRVCLKNLAGNFTAGDPKLNFKGLDPLFVGKKQVCLDCLERLLK